MAPQVELLTREGFAERMGVDVRTVDRWVAEGMPKRKVSGRVRFAWHDCRKWWEARIRDDERAKRHAGGDEDRVSKMADAKLERAQAEAEEARINLALKRSLTVPREFMRTEFGRIARALRARLLTLPTAWAPRLGACTSTAERQVMLQDAINEVLPALADLTKNAPAQSNAAAVSA